MNINIRRSVKKDIDLLEHIERIAFPTYQQSSRRSLQLSLNSTFQEVWIAELYIDKMYVPVGYITLHIHKRSLRIFSIGLLPEYKNKGIGKRLLKHAENIAISYQFEKISLEVDASNQYLIKWYEHAGYVKDKILEDYYSIGKHAYRFLFPIFEYQDSNRIMNLIVVDNIKNWNLSIENVKIISSNDYTSNPDLFFTSKNVRVFNLCNSYKYQTLGYYVSLLASARDHRAIPNVTTIRDFHDVKVIRSIANDIDEEIQKCLQKFDTESITFNVYFGNTINPAFRSLGNKLYQMFEAPLFQVSFMRNGKWNIKKIVPLSLNKIQENDLEIVKSFAIKYFETKRFVKKRLKHYTYDLAILINPHEQNPPSCNIALSKFKNAAEKVGFYTEFITKNDYARLSEFDALFIRETTNVNNHTYQISRRAYAEGLVVIDDPWSILRCSNKIFLHERLLHNGIQAPQSKIFYKGEIKLSTLQKLSYPLVLKQPDSAFSIGVVKVHSAEEMEQSLQQLFKTSELIIAQEFLPSEFDWRIGILDQRALFACKYYMAKGHWQIYNWQDMNEKSGDSECIPLSEVPKQVLAAAIKSAELIGDGLYGVDLKQIGNEVYVIEVNDNPSVDAGVEDIILGDNLYEKVMQSMITRIEMSRNIARFISVDPE